MRCVVIEDQKLRVVERPDPAPGRGDVLVEVAAAGLNAADLLQVRGLYPAPPGWPADIPGMELAGTVASVGDGVSDSLVGQRVCAIVGGGAQATHCVVPAEHLLAIPANIDIVSAGGFPEAFTTARDAFAQVDSLSEKRVLISGAAGGVGSAAVQLARAMGAHVVGVTRDERHHERLTQLGADELVTADELHTVAPVDFVLELVGAATLSAALGILAPHATVVVIGVGSGGSRVELNLLTLMVTRARITGSTLRSRSRQEKADVAALMRASVMSLWAYGDCEVPVAATFGLDDVARAYEAFGASGKFGKIILTTR